MSEAFDHVGVMLLHQKIMRDAEVATAYQLMVANPEEEPRKKKRKHKFELLGLWILLLPLATSFVSFWRHFL